MTEGVDARRQARRRRRQAQRCSRPPFSLNRKGPCGANAVAYSCSVYCGPGEGGVGLGWWGGEGLLLPATLPRPPRALRGGPSQHAQRATAGCLAPSARPQSACRAQAAPAVLHSCAALSLTLSSTRIRVPPGANTGASRGLPPLGACLHDGAGVRRHVWQALLLHDERCENGVAVNHHCGRGGR